MLPPRCHGEPGTLLWQYFLHAGRPSCNPGVGKLFMVEGQMGLQRACRGPDRYKSHKSTQ